MLDNCKKCKKQLKNDVVIWHDGVSWGRGSDQQESCWAECWIQCDKYMTTFDKARLSENASSPQQWHETH
jgi:hypothetical protein